MKADRRDFLRLAAGGVVGTAVSGVLSRGLRRRPEDGGVERTPPPAAQRWVPSICGECPGGCGVLARVVGGRVVKLEGNPENPINRGGLCPRGQAALQVLYDPDRIRTPLRRVGSRGSGKWQPVEWDEAIGMVASRLGHLRDGGQAHTAVWLSGRSPGLVTRLAGRLLESLGSPNLVQLATSDGSAAQRAALHAMQGVEGRTGYDLERTRCILSFGAGLLEGWGAPVWTMRAYGALRQGRQRSRGHLLQVDSRLSVTAAKADEWIPILPGTEAALALGIAYVLITERLYDRDFVRERTFGFDDWVDGRGRSHLGFRSLLLRENPLETTSQTTGVPLERILAVARTFGQNRPAIAIGQGGSVYDHMAIHSLNALVGSIDVPGGVLLQREAPYAQWSPVARTGSHAPMALLAAAPVMDPLEQLTDALAAERPYAAQALFVDAANPVYGAREPFHRALAKVPLVVSFSPAMDETAAMADLVLPDHTPLERWEESPTPPGVNFTSCGIRRPVIDPVHDTRHTGDVILDLARALGAPVSDAFPWTDFRQVLADSVTGLFEARRGYVMGSRIDESWYRLLERAGWWSPSYTSARELLQQMEDKGGWWDPFYYYGQWDRVCGTPSGRFEFYASQLALADGAPADDRARLPHYEPNPAAGDADVYPLHLNLYRPLALLDGGANQPQLQEILGPHVFEEWDSWAEMSPDTAAQLGLADGERVWVESPAGRLAVRLRLFAGAMPGSLNMALGLGHRAGGRWAAGRGVDPRDLSVTPAEPARRLGARPATRVKVYRA